jgi:hypothetical protein
MPNRKGKYSHFSFPNCEHGGADFAVDVPLN